MKKLKYILPAFLFITACEKDIRPDLNDPLNAIVIDAWLNDRDSVQQISVTRSQPYFEQEFPNKIVGATVTVTDNEGNLYIFEESDSTYIWRSPNSLPLAIEGRSYWLSVTIEGEDYLSFARMGRVPAIDSINFRFRPKDTFITQDFYTAEFVATDIVGEGDTYWIKAWKNSKYLGKPSEINLAFDAGFSAGGNVDGLVFIQPIQDAINPFDEDPENENEFLAPYLTGDSVYVEIHSINSEAFYFLTEVRLQTDRAGGFSALFAQPLANVTSNIFAENANNKKPVVGFFNVAAISSLGKKLTEEEASKAKEIWEEEQ